MSAVCRGAIIGVVGAAVLVLALRHHEDRSEYRDGLRAGRASCEATWEYRPARQGTGRHASL